MPVNTSGTAKKRPDLASLIVGSRDVREAKIPPQLYYGPRRAGKTVLGATASEQWPEDRKAGSGGTTITLEDILWVPFDAGALDALSGFNVEVENVVNVNAAFEYYNDNASAALSLIEEAIANVLTKNDSIRFVVIDTLSQLDSQLEAYYHGVVDDSQTLYRSMLGRHRNFASFLKTMPATPIELCHSRLVGEARGKKGDEANAKKRDKAAKAAKYFVVPEAEPAITGKGGEIYRANTSIQGVVLANNNAVSRALERRVFFRLKDGFEASSRFETVLDTDGKGEEPNLRAIYRKVGYIEESQNG